MRKILRIALVTFASGLVVCLIAAGVLYQASQQVPEFYEQALLLEPTVQEVEGDLLEQNVLQLHNEVREEGQWQAVFTDEQINGWLAVDMPEKFSNMLPGGIQNPRVVIDQELVRIACKYDSPKLSTVVSFGLEVRLTDEPNVLSVRVRQLRAGALPLPLKRFLDPIAAAAQDADITIRWTQVDGDPVALVTVPVQHERYLHKEIYLDSVELSRGEVYLAGHTEADRLASSQSVEAPRDTKQKDQSSEPDPVLVR